MLRNVTSALRAVGSRVALQQGTRSLSVAHASLTSTLEGEDKKVEAEETNSEAVEEEEKEEELKFPEWALYTPTSKEDLYMAEIPDTLTEADIGRVYPMSMDAASAWPEGLPKGRKGDVIEANVDKGAPVLIRKATMEVINHLNAVGTGKETAQKGIILDGKNHSGRSTSLATAVHYARSRGWLTVYIPQAGSWSFGSEAIGSILKDPSVPGTYAHDIVASNFLKKVVSGNETILKTIPLRASTLDNSSLEHLDEAGAKFAASIPTLELELTKGDKDSKFSLLDLVDFGVKNPEMAAYVAKHFRFQLNAVEEVPVLIAMDEYEIGYEVVRGFRDGGNHILGAQMQLWQLFGSFDHGLKRGTMLAATHRHDFILPGKKTPEASFFKDSAYSYNTKLSDKEFRNLVSHFHHEGHHGVGMAQEQFEKLKFITNGNINELEIGYLSTLPRSDLMSGDITELPIPHYVDSAVGSDASNEYDQMLAEFDEMEAAMDHEDFSIAEGEEDADVEAEVEKEQN